MLNIDNKIIRYQYGVTYKLFLLFATIQQTTSDCNKILLQQCNIYCQVNCQIPVKSAKANNSYSGFVRSFQKKHFSFRSSLSTKT